MSRKMFRSRIPVVVCLLACVLSGCSDDTDEALDSNSASRTVQDCVRACRDELEPALEKDQVYETAERLVAELDDFEDFVDDDRSEAFEKLHGAMEQLQTAAGSESNDDLKAKIDEIKKLAGEFLDSAAASAEG